MKNGTCPKCNSKEVYQHEDGFIFGDSSALSITVSQNGAFLVRSSMVYFTSYVCVNCGYFENYIRDDKGLESFKAIREKWEKVA